ncbi:hypothetical protein HpHCM55_07400 [Helicobacter pylori]
MQTIHIGVLSASDRASKGIYEDLSGKAIQEVLSEYLLNPLEFHYEIVADERDLIEKSLIKMRDEYQCDLVVTTELYENFIEDFKHNAPIWKYDLIHNKRIYAKERSHLLKGSGLLA